MCWSSRVLIFMLLFHVRKVPKPFSSHVGYNPLIISPDSQASKNNSPIWRSERLLFVFWVVSPSLVSALPRYTKAMGTRLVKAMLCCKLILNFLPPFIIHFCLYKTIHLTIFSAGLGVSNDSHIPSSFRVNSNSIFNLNDIQ